jgi:hypothetical protein
LAPGKRRVNNYKQPKNAPAKTSGIDRDGRAPRTVKIVGLGEDLGAREV